MKEQEVVRTGLLGWPVAHSVSPAMQNAAFQALALPWRYELLPVPPDELAAAVTGLEGRGFRGANVTVPHKETALALVDEADADARAIGAVNTLTRRGGGWLGANTDAAGFLTALREGGVEPAGRRALVLGAGGAARAVVYALGRAGCAVVVHNRTAERAVRLCADLGAAALAPLAVAPSLTGLDLDAIDLLVNATPVGQRPAAGASPWPRALPLPTHWTVFDLVYNPVETRLLAQARAAGATAIDGLEMLVYQGALSFRLWTGQEAPLDVMRAAARQALE